MKKFVVMLLKKMASDVLLSVAQHVVQELKGRKDNTLDKDADRIIDILKFNKKF